MATELEDGSLTLSQQLTACADSWEDSEASVGFLCPSAPPFLPLWKGAYQLAVLDIQHFTNPKPRPLLSSRLLLAKDHGLEKNGSSW